MPHVHLTIEALTDYAATVLLHTKPPAGHTLESAQTIFQSRLSKLSPSEIEELSDKLADHGKKSQPADPELEHSPLKFNLGPMGIDEDCRLMYRNQLLAMQTNLNQSPSPEQYGLRV